MTVHDVHAAVADAFGRFAPVTVTHRVGGTMRATVVEYDVEGPGPWTVTLDPLPDGRRVVARMDDLTHVGPLTPGGK